MANAVCKVEFLRSILRQEVEGQQWSVADSPCDWHRVAFCLLIKEQCD
jgi:hypothetical protein